uniref:hypothetical protein n=1 Tax=Prevotella sp. TaxID=59823 RepID=UPI0040274E13
MEQKQKVWIRGVEGRGDEVIKMLTDLGAKNRGGFVGNDPNRVYYITTDGAIACTRDGVIIKTLKNCCREIKLPEKWVTGYMLDTRQPVYDTLYFYITSGGDVQAALVKGILDYQRFRIGNFFHTVVEANGMAEKYRQLLEGDADEHQSKQIIRHVNITTINENGVYLVEKGFVPVRLKDFTDAQSAKRCNVMVSYHGHKWIVAKEDLKGDRLPLFSDGSHPEGTSSFYKCEIEALNDFDMMSCTEHLREAGLAFELDTDLCIPTAGQLAAMCLYRKELNKALEMVGGTPMKKETYWSSCEGSAKNSWNVDFSGGYVGNYCKYGSYYVRPCTAFEV